MSEQAAVTTLTDDECWEVLAAASVGRLATAIAGTPEIFPVSFAVHAGAIYFVTKPGTKLVELVVNSRVAFEADDVDDRTATSVVVKGTADILEADADIEVARASGVVPYVQDGRNVWVRIRPGELTGRRFTR